MKVQVYKSLWGMEGSLESQLAYCSDSGYDGIECAIAEIADRKQFRDLLESSHLLYIPLIYTEGASVDAHVSDLRRLVSIALEMNPIKIVAHAGRDLWTIDEQCRFFEAAFTIEQEVGIAIAHETHRRRPLYSPMNAAVLFEKFPELRINADLSHWCCVTESMLEDHAGVIQTAIERTIHIHSRVGYENGPQVSDPRINRWAAHLKIFEQWWKQMAEAQAEKNEIITVTPEYGPPTYMQTLPGTDEPVSDLNEICLWAAGRFRKLVA